MRLCILENDAADYKRKLEELIKSATKLAVVDLTGLVSDPAGLSALAVRALASTKPVFNNVGWWDKMFSYWPYIDRPILDQFRNQILSGLKTELEAAVKAGVVIENTATTPTTPTTPININVSPKTQSKKGGGFLSVLFNIAKILFKIYSEGRRDHGYSRYGRYDGYSRRSREDVKPDTTVSTTTPTTSTAQSPVAPTQPTAQDHPLKPNPQASTTFKLATMNQYVVFEFVRMCKEHMDELIRTGKFQTDTAETTEYSAKQVQPSTAPSTTPSTTPKSDQTTSSGASNITPTDRPDQTRPRRRWK